MDTSSLSSWLLWSLKATPSLIVAAWNAKWKIAFSQKSGIFSPIHFQAKKSMHHLQQTATVEWAECFYNINRSTFALLEYAEFTDRRPRSSELLIWKRGFGVKNTVSTSFLNRNELRWYFLQSCINICFTIIATWFI